MENQLNAIKERIKIQLFSSSGTDKNLVQLVDEKNEIALKLALKEQDFQKSINKNKYLSLDEMSESLNRTEAFILILPTYYEDQHLIYTIDAEGHWIDIIDVSVEDIAAQTTELRLSLEVNGAGELQPFNFNISNKIYEEFLEWQIISIEEYSPYVNSIKYSFYGPLQSIPPTLLVRNVETKSFLADKYDFSLLPAPNSILFLKPPEIKISSSFWGGGQPNVSGERFASLRGISFVDIEQQSLNSKLQRLAPLPETKDEIINLSRLFNGSQKTIRLGKSFNEKSILDENFSNFDLIAFATHGLQANEIFETKEAALVVPFVENNFPQSYDGLLTSTEISELNLNAELVILSACNTAYSNSQYEEVLSGLTSAFFAAGTQSLLVSNWAIDSKTTADFTVKIIEKLIDEPDLSPAKALQEVAREIRISGLTHPFYWSSFIYAGR
jgi:CHAT domain-containing protein